jgi:hypothetical protein
MREKLLFKVRIQKAGINSMNRPSIPPDLYQHLHQRDSTSCPFCNGAGTKRWGKLGVRACVHCKGTGKKER